MFLLWPHCPVRTNRIQCPMDSSTLHIQTFAVLATGVYLEEMMPSCRVACIC